MLRIWEGDPYNGVALSQDGELTSPLIFKVPPTGGVREIQLWLRHDELSGEFAESSYEVVVEGADDYVPDYSGWVEVAPDVAGTPGTYAASLNVGDILLGDIVPFWVRVTVPDTPETGAHEDIYLRLTNDSTVQTRDIRLQDGTFYNCEYNFEDGTIDYDVEETEGRYLSAWIDISLLDLTGFSYGVSGSVAYVSYRTSTDASEDTATAWVSDIEELDLTDQYLQFEIKFYPPSNVGVTGLIRRIYGNTDFSVYKTTSEGGVIPNSATPGDTFGFPKSIKWSGFFHATSAGVYNFRTVSNDGHRLYVNSQLVHENWTTTSQSGTVSSNGNIFLPIGWHFVEYQYFHADGDDTISSFVTFPSVAERAITLADFTPVQRVVKVNYLRLHFQGSKDLHYDVRIYDGPDVPELIDPENGYETQLFNPELTVYQRNCEYVEFQMDVDPYFLSGFLIDWIDPVAPETFHTSTAPIGGARPPGIWYWRARGITNGVFSEWSDWRFLEILPLVTHSEFLYLNVNLGLAPHDSIVDARFVHLNLNMGLAPHDPIVDPRFIYLNVNIDLPIGKIVYPFKDDTLPRKDVFAGDGPQWA